MRYLTIIHDIDGLPRAWGSASSRQDSIAVAERQWARRLEERADYLDRSEQRGKLTTEEAPENDEDVRHRVLEEWLRGVDARLLFLVDVDKLDAMTRRVIPRFVAALEMYRISAGTAFVLRYSHDDGPGGWEIYTAHDSNSMIESLRDAETRLNVFAPRTGALAWDALSFGEKEAAIGRALDAGWSASVPSTWELNPDPRARAIQREVYESSGDPESEPACGAIPIFKEAIDRCCSLRKGHVGPHRMTARRKGT